MLPINAFCKNQQFEIGECSASEYVAAQASGVLQIGGGFGTVTKTIQVRLKDPSKHVIVESNPENCAKQIKLKKDNKYNYKVLCKGFDRLKAEEVRGLDSIIMDCGGCALKFFKTSAGNAMAGKLKMFYNEMDDPNNDEKIREYLHGLQLCPYFQTLSCNKHCTGEIWGRDACQEIEKECRSKERVFCWSPLMKKNNKKDSTTMINNYFEN